MNNRKGRQNDPSSSEGSSEESSSEEDTQQRRPLQGKSGPNGSNGFSGSSGSIMVNKSPVVEKLGKIEQLLLKFNEINQLQPLITAFSNNVKLLEGLKLNNLDNLKYLDQLTKLNVLDNVSNGLAELVRLKDLSKLKSLDKLEVFNDDRINKLFISIEAINSKVTDMVNNVISNNSEKLTNLNTKIDILTTSLKPFRETNYANKMLELPNTLASTLANFTEKNNVGSTLNIFTDKLDTLSTSFANKNDNDIQLISSLSSLKESIASLVKYGIQKSDLEVIERNILETTEKYNAQKFNTVEEKLESVKRTCVQAENLISKLYHKESQCVTQDIIKAENDKLNQAIKNISDQIMERVTLLDNGKITQLLDNLTDKVKENKDDEIVTLIKELNGKENNDEIITLIKEMTGKISNDEIVTLIKELNGKISNEISLMISELSGKVDKNVCVGNDLIVALIKDLSKKVDNKTFTGDNEIITLIRKLGDRIEENGHKEIVKIVDADKTNEEIIRLIGILNVKVDQDSTKDSIDTVGQSISFLGTKIDEVSTKDSIDVINQSINNLSVRLSESLIKDRNPPQNNGNLVELLETLNDKTSKIMSDNTDKVMGSINTFTNTLNDYSKNSTEVTKSVTALASQIDKSLGDRLKGDEIVRSIETLNTKIDNGILKFQSDASPVNDLDILDSKLNSWNKKLEEEILDILANDRNDIIKEVLEIKHTEPNLLSGKLDDISSELDGLMEEVTSSKLGSIRGDLINLNQLVSEIKKELIAKGNSTESLDVHNSNEEVNKMLEVKNEIKGISDLRDEIKGISDLRNEIKGISDLRDEIKGISDLRNEIKGISDLRDEIKGISDLRDEIKGISDLRDEIKGISDLKEEIKGISDLRDEIKGISDLRDEIKGISDLRDEIKGISDLRDEIKGISDLRDEIKEVSYLREEVKKINVDDIMSQLKEGISKGTADLGEEIKKVNIFRPVELEGLKDDISKKILDLKDEIKGISDLKEEIKGISDLRDEIKGISGLRDEMRRMPIPSEQIAELRDEIRKMYTPTVPMGLSNLDVKELKDEIRKMDTSSNLNIAGIFQQMVKLKDEIKKMNITEIKDDLKNVVVLLHQIKDSGGVAPVMQILSNQTRSIEKLGQDFGTWANAVSQALNEKISSLK